MRKERALGIIAIDLGTTNVKVAAVDAELNFLATQTREVSYVRGQNTVEFDVNAYFRMVAESISSCRASAGLDPSHVRQLVFTGQAESLILLGSDGRPLCNGISWLDMRSEAECGELQRVFPQDQTYPITGQHSIIPTWPITKILWLRKNKPDIYGRVSKFLLLKDYILYRLTDELAGEFSIYNFSHYFDIAKKEYWRDILDYCGVRRDQLPALVEPQTVIGTLTAEASKSLGLDRDVKVNVGTLDHFAGMIGTGNIDAGTISEATGTVLSIATMVRKRDSGESGIPVHYGPFRDTYVYLSVCESGGVSLEWFRNAFLTGMSYPQLEAELVSRQRPTDLVFLPYLTGVNAPDFNAGASGTFFGLKLHHDKVDMAQAVMEGVAHLLKKNTDVFEKAGIRTRSMISTGGGARSDYWSQVKADVTGYTVSIPEIEEAPTLGAAMIGAVSEGYFGSFETAVRKCVKIRKSFRPVDPEPYRLKQQIFDLLYSQLLPVYVKARGIL
jgi:xylulokinase